MSLGEKEREEKRREIEGRGGEQLAREKSSRTAGLRDALALVRRRETMREGVEREREREEREVAVLCWKTGEGLL